MQIDPRVQYAAERTLLAWIRTGLAMMGFGFVVARFSLLLRELTGIRGELPPTPGWSRYIGTGIVALGVLVTFTASIRHRRDIRRMKSGLPIVEADSVAAGEIVGFALGIIGVVMTVYLLRLSF
jgi:putative membrane protein